jgi:hypothetical protein
MKTMLSFAFALSLAAAPALAAPVLSFDLSTSTIGAARFDVVENPRVTAGITVLDNTENPYEIILCNVSADGGDDGGFYDVGPGGESGYELGSGRCVELVAPKMLNLQPRRSGRPWTARIFIRRVGSN